ncbi:MAG TPA: hypothetical protein VF157_01510 [Chloroflexota bacterium]
MLSVERNIPSCHTRRVVDLRITQVSAQRANSHWRVAWRIHNDGREPLTILSAWLPHSSFRSNQWQLDPPLAIAPNGDALLESTVTWPGSDVENAFLILRLPAGRVFARLRVSPAAGGAPLAVCEAVT